jgi:drug/metabolite transporter (DMT)-like permease
MEGRGGSDRPTLAAFATLVLLVGANVVAVRFSVRELAPLYSAAIRFATAAVLMLAIARLWHVPLPRGRSLLGAALFGVLGFTAFFAFGYYGLKQTPAGLAAMIFAAVPLLTLLFAVTYRLERLHWRNVTGAILSLGGIGIMSRVTVDLSVPLLSILAVMAAAICEAQAGILIKLFPGIHPVGLNAVALPVGAVLLFALSLVTREDWVVPSLTATWLSLLYLVVLGSIAVFILYVFVFQRWTASAASYLFVLSPIPAVLLGVWLLDEKVTLPYGVGAALVLIGVYIGALAVGGEPRLNASKGVE